MEGGGVVGNGARKFIIYIFDNAYRTGWPGKAVRPIPDVKGDTPSSLLSGLQDTRQVGQPWNRWASLLAHLAGVNSDGTRKSNTL